ncbi:MAG: SpoVG family protein [Candidatus Omnitrophota bacterium]
MTQDTKLEVVRLHRFENGGAVKAFCDIQFGEDYIIKGFKLVDGKQGMFVGMPSESGKDGRWFSTFMPLTDDVKSRIEAAVVAAYEE